jgi:galactonate dehydratase
MKIAELDTHVVAVPPPHVGGMYWIFVCIRTECGIEGIGEIYATSFHPRAVVPLIQDVFDAPTMMVAEKGADLILAAARG